MTLPEMRALFAWALTETIELSYQAGEAGAHEAGAGGCNTAQLDERTGAAVTRFPQPAFGNDYIDRPTLPDLPHSGLKRGNLCWCRSGLKYRHCHFQREQDKPPTEHEMAEIHRLEFLKGDCLHPAQHECSRSGAIRSHSIQRGGGLASIAESGHVLTAKQSALAVLRSEKKFQLKKIGIGQASIFPGFCDLHDARLFQPIENKTISINRHTALLFAYRVIALEVQRKRAAISAMRRTRQRLDAGQPAMNQYLMQRDFAYGMHGFEIGLHDIDGYRLLHESQLFESASSGANFYAVWFDGLLPIVATTAYLPAYGFNGAVVQDVYKKALEGITLTVTSFEGRSLALITWLGSMNGPAANFAQSFAEIADEHLADALLNGLFSMTDNLYVRIGWWNGLSPKLQAHYLLRCGDGLPTSDEYAMLSDWPIAATGVSPSERISPFTG